MRHTVERAGGSPVGGRNEDRGIRRTQKHYNGKGLTDEGSQIEEHKVSDEDSRTGEGKRVG